MSNEKDKVVEEFHQVEVHLKDNTVSKIVLRDGTEIHRDEDLDSIDFSKLEAGSIFSLYKDEELVNDEFILLSVNISDGKNDSISFELLESYVRRMHRLEQTIEV